MNLSVLNVILKLRENGLYVKATDPLPLKSLTPLCNR